MGGVTLSLGMRPRRPRMSVPLPAEELTMGGPGGFDGAVTRYVKDQGQGWRAQGQSQYKDDYAMPKYREMAAAQSTQKPLQSDTHQHQVHSQYVHDFGLPKYRKFPFETQGSKILTRTNSEQK
ncbi:unnamed protein product, partial [Polarella glacialis]